MNRHIFSAVVSLVPVFALGGEPASAAPAVPPPVLSDPARPAAEAPKAPQFVFAMHGFVGGTVFVQDAPLRPGEGGLGLWVAPRATTGGSQPNEDRLVLSGDIRQSRLNFSVAGPSVLQGATPKAVVELDFYGGYAGGTSSDTSPLPRLRHAYVELDWSGRHRLLIGQANDLMVAQVPVSLAHLGQPLGFVSGMQGWRRPGVFGFHTLGDRKRDYLELSWELGRADWNNTTSGSLSTADVYGFQNGEASGLPATEARVVWGRDTTLTAFAVGHWNRVDRSGVGSSSTAGVEDLSILVGQVGGKAIVGPVTMLVEGFTGKNLGGIHGAFTQIQAATVGDVHEYGGYVQAGYNFTKEISLFGYVGTDKISEEDAVAANFAVKQNTITSFLLQYREAGFACGLEWDHYITQTRNTVTVNGTRDSSLDGEQTGNKVSLNGIYFF